MASSDQILQLGGHVGLAIGQHLFEVVVEAGEPVVEIQVWARLLKVLEGKVAGRVLVEWKPVPRLVESCSGKWRILELVCFRC